MSSRATRRRCARSPTSGPSPARSAPRTRTGSLSPPRPRTERSRPALLSERGLLAVALIAGGAAVSLLLVWLIFRERAVDEATVNFAPISFAEIEGWREDDQAEAFKALLKSCGKASPKTPASSAPLQAALCADARGLALKGEVGRDAAFAFFEAHYTPYRI